MMFTSQAQNQKMMEQLIDQEETVRVCHYCHTKVFMNDQANDGDGLIADKLEFPVTDNNPSGVVAKEETSGVEEMAMWLGAGDVQQQKKLKQTQLQMGTKLISNEQKEIEIQQLGSEQIVNNICQSCEHFTCQKCVEPCISCQKTYCPFCLIVCQN